MFTSCKYTCNYPEILQSLSDYFIFLGEYPGATPTPSPQWLRADKRIETALDIYPASKFLRQEMVLAGRSQVSKPGQLPQLSYKKFRCYVHSTTAAQTHTAWSLWHQRKKKKAEGDPPYSYWKEHISLMLIVIKHLRNLCSKTTRKAQLAQEAKQTCLTRTRKIHCYVKTSGFSQSCLLAAHQLFLRLQTASATVYSTNKCLEHLG